MDIPDPRTYILPTYIESYFPITYKRTYIPTHARKTVLSFGASGSQARNILRLDTKIGEGGYIHREKNGLNAQVVHSLFQFDCEEIK